MLQQPSDGRSSDPIIFGSLLGFAAVAVLELVDLEMLDLPLKTALGLMTTAIPILAGGIIVQFARQNGATIRIWQDFIAYFGCTLVVLGFGALLFHFAWYFGALLLISSLAAFIAFRRRD